MGKTRTVLLYGNSLIISGIAASLQNEPHLRLCRVEAGAPDLADRLTSLAPDTLIFDLVAAHPNDVIALTERCPGLLLIGVEPDNDRIVQWRGHEAHALTVQDLLHAIRGATPSGSPLDRLWASVRGQFSRLTRRRKLSLGLAAIGLCSVPLLAHLLLDPATGGETLLGGTAAGSVAIPAIWLAFAAGSVLGGVFIGLWLRSDRRRET